MSADEVLVHLDSVSVRRGRTEVLHDVGLTVSRGEIVAVVGPNGAGKSTLLDTISDVLPTSSGNLVRHGRVASVMQTPGLARRSARANVELALAWWGVPRPDRRDRAMHALDEMQAGHLADRRATSLSGGERRRVHLARGVAVAPDLLLLDEPFAGLDPSTHTALCDDAASALRTSAGAVVLVVHDRTEAWAMADRLVIMMDGRIVADGEPQHLLESPPSEEVAAFLGYDGVLHEQGSVLRTRGSHVHIDPDGDLVAIVTRVVRDEDGARVDLDTGRGTLKARVRDIPRAGDSVRVRVVGGARFPQNRT